jgi:hypothetical protein
VTIVGVRGLPDLAAERAKTEAERAKANFPG